MLRLGWLVVLLLVVVAVGVVPPICGAGGAEQSLQDRRRSSEAEESATEAVALAAVVADVDGALHLRPGPNGSVFINGIDIEERMASLTETIRTVEAASAEQNDAINRFIALRHPDTFLSDAVATDLFSIQYNATVHNSGPPPAPETSTWAEPALGTDGCVYAFPVTGPHILKFNPRTRNTSTITVPDGILCPEENRCNPSYFGTIAVSSKLYGIPFGADNVIIMDPATGAISTEAIRVTPLSFAGGAVGFDNLIYAIPFSSPYALVINPATNTTDFPSSVPTGAGKWIGGVRGPQGRIYGIPSAYPALLIITPASMSASNTVTVDYASVPVASFSPGGWWGGVLGLDNKIYGIPHGAGNHVLVFDPVTSALDVESLRVDHADGNGYTSGAVLANGVVVSSPLSSEASHVLCIDPAANTTRQIPLPEEPGVSENQWVGGVATSRGKRGFFIPRRGSGHVLEVFLDLVLH